MRKEILETGERRALRARFRELLDNGEHSDEELDLKAAQWANNWYTDPSLREPQAKIGITEDQLAALVYIHRQKEMAGLEKQIAGAESRRNKLLREMHFHRETAAYREQLEELARPKPEPQGNILTASIERWRKELERTGEAWAVPTAEALSATMEKWNKLLDEEEAREQGLARARSPERQSR